MLKGFTEFDGVISNYETDVFRPFLISLRNSVVIVTAPRYLTSVPDAQ